MAMPEAFRASGLLFGIGQLVLACMVNYISSSCLLYTSFEWNCFSYSKLANNCSGKLFTKFVDLVFFVNCFFTTLSYTVLIQGNMTTFFSFVRSKIWKTMPSHLDDQSSVIWIIIFAVGILYTDPLAAFNRQARAEEFDRIFIYRVRDIDVHHGHYGGRHIQRRQE